jgi:hypothetical protein
LPAPRPTSFHRNTRPSYEQEARMEPKEGCAHASCQTGAVCLLFSLAAPVDISRVTTSAPTAEGSTHPFRIAGSPLASPLTTLNILIVRSDEHVAKRLP